MTPSRPTFKQIAAMANVSPATVSRVVNGTEKVAPGTRRRVFDTLREAGYGLTKKDLVGLIVPDTANPYFANMGAVFQEQLDRLGVHVMAVSSEGRPDRELALVNEFKSLGLQGLVYIAASEPRDAVLQALADDDIPVVIFDRFIQAGNFDFVAVDNRSGISRAVDYLVTLGHERIGHVKGPEGARNARDRREAFVEAMGRNGLDVNEAWIWPGDYGFGAGRSVAEDLLAQRDAGWPTAVLSGNDVMALGLMQRLQQEGVVIPRDMSVIGFDNIAITDWVYPRLTTLEQPVRALAYHAITFLMERIRHHKGDPDAALAPRLVELDPKLIPRESTAPPSG